MALEITFTGTAKGDARSHRPDHPTVAPGAALTLAWKVTGASACKLVMVMASGETVLDPAPPAEGTREVKSIDTPGRFRLEATAADGQTLLREVVVEVEDPDATSAVAGVEANPWLEAHPLLLCGPLLRRVTGPGEGGKSQVTVFLAAKEPLSVRLKVRPSGGAFSAPSAAVRTVPLGPHLHLCAVTGSFGLEPGARFDYDLELGDGRGLATGGVVTLGPLQRELGPADGALPSFLAPPATLEELRVVHGSCRKSGGAGLDALGLVAGLLDDDARHPHQLLLTGDQIYADEVPPAMLALARDRARLLLAADDEDFSETFPPQSAETPAGCARCCLIFSATRSSSRNKAKSWSR